MTNLRTLIETAWEDRMLLQENTTKEAIRSIIDLLDKGEVRVAEPTSEGWQVNEWIKKYNRKDLMNTRVKVETKDEISRIKALQKEIEQLKKLLLKKDLDAMVEESYLEVAAEDLGYKSIAELKKKLSIKP